MNNKSSSQWGHSLRVLSWDSEESLSNTETLISDTVHGWYNKKHKEETESERQKREQLERARAVLLGMEKH